MFFVSVLRKIFAIFGRRANRSDIRNIIPLINQLLSVSHVGQVQTDQFFKRISTEPAHVVQPHEEGAHQTRDPSKDEQDSKALISQKSGIKGSTTQRVEETDKFILVECIPHGTRGTEQANSDHPPNTVDHVNWNSIDSVVQSNGHQQLGTVQIQNTPDKSNQNGSPVMNRSTWSGNSHKGTKGTVHGL